MKQENTPFRNQDKIQDKANTINEAVDEHFQKPRVHKTKPKSDVAREIIKGQEENLVPFRKIPEELRPWVINLRDAGVSILEDGFLEISRWDNTGKNFSKPKLLKQKVDGLESAIRMQGHVLEGYRSSNQEKGDEYEKLESMQEVIEEANSLLNDWKFATKENRKEIQNKLSEVVLQLEKCRNEFKLEVKDQATEVAKMKDSLGRDNPSALAARTVGAINSLRKRIEEMQLISPLIALRKEVLVLERRRSVSTIKKADSLISGILNHSVFKENNRKPASERIKDHEVEILNRKLGEVLYMLDTVYVAPYFQKAKQAEFFIANDIKKLFRSKESLVSNVDFVISGLKEVQSILTAEVAELG